MNLLANSVLIQVFVNLKANITRIIEVFVCKRLFFCFSGDKEISLSIENTLWANTVIASGTAIGMICTLF
jgi:hypothetical protein